MFPSNFDVLSFTEVIINHRFYKGEIVYDYHGKVIQASEGRAMLQAQDEGMCYLFFKDEERGLCINAQTFPCLCHEHMEMVGRKINHSKKKTQPETDTCYDEH